MVFTVQKTTFTVESYNRTRSCKATREKFKQKYGAEITQWFEFEHPVAVVFRLN
jgi:hypothetical protein